MPSFFLDDLYARTLQAEGYLDTTRQPRSSQRDAQPLQVLRARDLSASSSEHRSSSSRRSSLFSKRPKSTMTTKSSEAGYGADSRRSSTTTDTSVLPVKSDASKSRFHLGRGRKLTKSAGSKVRANSATDSHDDGFVPRNRESKHKRESSGGSRASSKDLFSDFRALRRGHRTAVIGPPRTPQADEQEQEQARPQRGPAPIRPKRSDEHMKPHRVLAPETFGMEPLRQIRSAEHISPGRQPSQTTNPPNRPLNRPAPLNPALFPPMSINNIPHLSNISITDDWDRLLPLYENRSPSFSPLNSYFGSIHSIPHSETITDHIKSPMFIPPLEQVPEEPEGTLSDRQSRDITHRSSIRHAKSSPILSPNSFKSSFRKRSQVSPGHKTTERPDSQGSDTLGDLTRLTDDSHSSIDGAVEQFSTPMSWEDDIDYCYEHAAEADCDFDWNDMSRYDESDNDDLYVDDGPHLYASIHKDISKSNGHSGGGILSDSAGEGYQLTNRVYKVPSKDALPELEYRSSHSTSTNSVSLLTPLDKFSFPSSESSNSQRASGKDNVSSQLLYGERSESEMHQIYDDLLAKPEGAPPAVPPRSASRTENMGPYEQTREHAAVPLLSTPPPSANQSPVIPNEKPPRKKLHVNTIVATLRRQLESPVSPDDPPPPPPKSPRFQSRHRASTLGATRPNRRDAQVDARNSSQEWPLMIPRSGSETSVVTAIPVSKSPTPAPGSPPTAKLPTPPGIANAVAPPLAQPASNPAIENAYLFPPRSTSRSFSVSNSDSSRRPMTPPSRPQTAVRPSRSSYSLFPQPTKTQGSGPANLELTKSATFVAPLKSAPLYGSFPSKPFSSRFEQFKHGTPALPKNAGFKARQRAFQIMP
ncbi:hypothetical protein FKW77_009005 [Venturia effusa]|uniref:Uncharacterized protein n=1 Tax=Venturia effusa TaxID=50376 RepID=A0A517L421_9PEZI|nr:hypothetical protein FKW77_009005 [Venturia effusa]